MTICTDTCIFKQWEDARVCIKTNIALIHFNTDQYMHIRAIPSRLPRYYKRVVKKRLKLLKKKLDALSHRSFLVTFLFTRDYLKYLKLFIIDRFKTSNGNANNLTGYLKYQTIAAFIASISVWQTNTKPRLSCLVFLIFLRMQAPARPQRRIYWPIHENHCPSHQSAQRVGADSAEVQATNIKRGFVKLYLIATCFMPNQPID